MSGIEQQRGVHWQLDQTPRSCKLSGPASHATNRGHGASVHVCDNEAIVAVVRHQHAAIPQLANGEDPGECFVHAGIRRLQRERGALGGHASGCEQRGEEKQEKARTHESPLEQDLTGTSSSETILSTAAVYRGSPKTMCITPEVLPTSCRG